VNICTMDLGEIRNDSLFRLWLLHANIDTFPSSWCRGTRWGCGGTNRPFNPLLKRQKRFILGPIYFRG
jgi:hypothetical protein